MTLSHVTLWSQVNKTRIITLATKLLLGRSKYKLPVFRVIS